MLKRTSALAKRYGRSRRKRGEHLSDGARFGLGLALAGGVVGMGIAMGVPPHVAMMQYGTVLPALIIASSAGVHGEDEDEE